MDVEGVDFDFFEDEPSEKKAISKEESYTREESGDKRRENGRYEDDEESVRTTSSRSSLVITAKIPIENKSYSSSEDDDYVLHARRQKSRPTAKSEKRAVVGLPVKSKSHRSRDEDPGKRQSSETAKKVAAVSSGKRRSRKYSGSDSDSDSRSSYSRSSYTSSSRSHSRSRSSSDFSTVTGSDSDVTNVSPLSSARSSPSVSFEKPPPGRGRHARSQSAKVAWASSSGDPSPSRPRPATAADLLNTTQNLDEELAGHHRPGTGGRYPGGGAHRTLSSSETRELSMLLQAVLDLDKDQGRRPAGLGSAGYGNESLQSGTAQSRRNMSFSNDQVRDIDTENQRLLQNIMYTVTKGSGRERQEVPRRPSHAAINRKRQQRKIEMENRQLLRRIEQARPSSHLQRNKLLLDHNRTMNFGVSQQTASRRKTNTGSIHSAASSTTGSSRAGSHLGLQSSPSSHRSHVTFGSRPSSGRSDAAPTRAARPASGRSDTASLASQASSRPSNSGGRMAGGSRKPIVMLTPPTRPRQVWSDRW